MFKTFVTVMKVTNCKTPCLDNYKLKEMQALITNLLHMNKAYFYIGFQATDVTIDTVTHELSIYAKLFQNPVTRTVRCEPALLQSHSR